MKKILCISLLLFVLMCETCMGAVVYPEYSTDNMREPKITERINIVFDNSGHEYVKYMFMDVITAAAFAENTDIWLYPIAGSIEPIKLVPSKEFMDKYFVTYSKSSNEFKPENVLDKAIADLNADTSVENKRLILYCDSSVYEIRSEYHLFEIDPYVMQNPEIIFSSFYPGNCVESYNITDEQYNPLSNYEGISGKNVNEFLMVKYGYSECEATYNQEEGYIKIDKGQADNNIFVTAEVSNGTFDYWKGREEADSCLYLGGCMMDTEGFEKYNKKDKVKGVSLSYNHISTDAGQNGNHFVAALYSTDGNYLNAAQEDLYIPLINASDVKVYYRSIKGAGVCGANVTYNAKQDKEIVNYNAPDEPETSEDGSIAEVIGNNRVFAKKETNKGFFAIVWGLILGIIRFALGFVYLGIIAFIIGLVVNRKFRDLMQLKVMSSKLEPLYTKISNWVINFINDLNKEEIKVKGTVTPGSEYIFISKASADLRLKHNRVTRIVKELESRGIQCWDSDNSIEGSENFNEQIAAAIKRSTMMVCFLSVNSIKSANVETEINYAKGDSKPVFPVIISNINLLKNDKWSFILSIYEAIEAFKSDDASIKEYADKIEAKFKKVKSKK